MKPAKRVDVKLQLIIKYLPNPSDDADCYLPLELKMIKYQQKYNVFVKLGKFMKVTVANVLCGICQVLWQLNFIIF